MVELYSLPVAASEDKVIDSTPLGEVLTQAETLQLAQHDTWLALLHYKRETVLRRYISQADDKKFFIATNGQTDAAAELEADIKAFMSASLENTVHAQCLFPARWWWIKQQTGTDERYDVSCPKLESFMKRVAHNRLYLVFPSMYLNNPGSTFGHTFLRFDDENGSILLSQTLNYAARVDHSDGMMSYVSKGLFGGYTGFFRARPYFEMVQEYNNIENRDIWEYRLNFTEAEIEQLVRHVWEVRGIDFDYYFFRENCSYRLLALLDVIRPGMQLTAEEGFPVYAIPVDTVRALDQTGLILTRYFRASLATQIDEGFIDKSASYSSLALEISDSSSLDKELIINKLIALNSRDEQLEVLDQSYRLLQFHGDTSSSRAQVVLQLINDLSAPQSEMVTSDIDLANRTSLTIVSPEAGHDSVRLTAGYGEQNSLSYIDLKFRPAFHDLLDAPQGYVNGAAINVFETHLKWFVNNDSTVNTSVDGLRFESLSLFNVASLSPLSRWQKPVSWMFDFRFDRTQLSSTNSVRNFISRGGAGISVRTHGFTPYVMLTGEWNLASAYDRGYSVLIGVLAGVHLNLPSNQLSIRVQLDEAISGFELDRKERLLQWQYNLQVNHAMRLKYRHTDYTFFNDEDWSIDYNYYF